MTTRSKKNILSACTRSQHSGSTSATAIGRHRRRSIRKSHKIIADTNSSHLPEKLPPLVGVPTVDENSVQADTANDKCNLELTLIDLMSSNSVDTEAKESSCDTDRSSKYTIRDLERKVTLIEGNKAIVVNALEWPKTAARVPLTELYKLPNPRLTAGELRRQNRLVRERREHDDETRREKIRLKYMKSIYCLPKKLIMESKSRLVMWYTQPGEDVDLRPAEQIEGEGYNNPDEDKKQK